MKHELITALLGGIEPLSFLAAFIYACIGAYLSLQVKANTRDVEKAGSPKNFSYAYLIRDNWRRIVYSLVLIAIAMRFSQEILGQQLTQFLAFFIGLSLDKLSGLISKLGGKQDQTEPQKFTQGPGDILPPPPPTGGKP